MNAENSLEVENKNKTIWDRCESSYDDSYAHDT